MALILSAFSFSLEEYHIAMKKRPVAVFDIDGTVFRSSLFLELVERLIDGGVFPKKARSMYEKERLLWLDRKGKHERYTEKAVAMFLTHIKGVPMSAVEPIVEDILREKRHRVYRYTRSLIKALKKKGYFLLAVTHSPRFIADLFAYEYGFDKVYGFFYETDQKGTFTGKVMLLDLIRNKDKVLKRAVRKENLTLKGSVGVGDTESDIPMLALVERAIAFNPNKKLYEHAKKKNWKIVVERKDVVYEL